MHPRLQDAARKREAQKVLAELRGRVQLLSVEQERAALQRLLGPELAAAAVRPLLWLHAWRPWHAVSCSAYGRSGLRSAVGGRRCPAWSCCTPA